MNAFPISHKDVVPVLHVESEPSSNTGVFRFRGVVIVIAQKELHHFVTGLRWHFFLKLGNDAVREAIVIEGIDDNLEAGSLMKVPRRWSL